MRLVVGVLAVLALGFAAWSLGTSSAASSARACRIRGDLPDRVCTPGRTAYASREQVCRPGYATSVRPSRSESHRLKVRAFRRYGISGPFSAYQLDHLVPLELGGDPRADANLWPDPIAAAHRKDRAENRAHREVCSGSLSLRRAQRVFETDWRRVP